MDDTLALDGGSPVREERLQFATPVIGDAEVERVTEALRSGWLTTGGRTADFEDAICEYVDAAHAVGTTNCTSALYLAQRALEVTGEVVTTPMTFASTVSSGLMADATPVLADIRRDTLTLDPESVKEVISTDTEAILPVHYAGQATDMDALYDLAADHNLALIEDAAHGLGGQFEGEDLGTLGDAGCYSFYATKSITTSEGGMLVTDDEATAEAVDRLRLAGVDKTTWERSDTDQPDWHYDVTAVSGKFNMTDIQASLGLAQLDRLDGFLSTRRTLAGEYDAALADVPGITPLSVRDETEHARHIYPIILETDVAGLSRIEFDRRLNAEGIDTSVHYIPIHHHSAFEDVDRVSLETTEDVAEKVICLPLHPEIDTGDIDDVVRAVRKVLP